MDELALLAKARPAVASLTLGPLRGATCARVFEQMAAEGELRNTLTTTAPPVASGGPPLLNLARARDKVG